MKIVVFSDSHGISYNLERVVRMQFDTADCFIHLGDGAAEFDSLRERYKDCRFFSVKGNCDSEFGSDGVKAVRESVLDFAGHSFFITHGDMYGVKYTTENLKLAALSHSAEVALFGHSHQRFYEYSYVSDIENERIKQYMPDYVPRNTIHLFNPGSISRPAYDTPSWGVIEITKSGIAFSHGSIN